MLDVIKQLLDKDLVTEDTRAAIQEAWDQKLAEVKEEAKTCLLYTSDAADE